MLPRYAMMMLIYAYADYSLIFFADAALFFARLFSWRFIYADVFRCFHDWCLMPLLLLFDVDAAYVFRSFSLSWYYRWYYCYVYYPYWLFFYAERHIWLMIFRFFAMPLLMPPLLFASAIICLIYDRLMMFDDASAADYYLSPRRSILILSLFLFSMLFSILMPYAMPWLCLRCRYWCRRYAILLFRLFDTMSMPDAMPMPYVFRFSMRFWFYDILMMPFERADYHFHFHIVIFFMPFSLLFIHHSPYFHFHRCLLILITIFDCHFRFFITISFIIFVIISLRHAFVTPDYFHYLHAPLYRYAFLHYELRGDERCVQRWDADARECRGCVQNCLLLRLIIRFRFDISLSPILLFFHYTDDAAFRRWLFACHVAWLFFIIHFAWHISLLLYLRWCRADIIYYAFSLRWCRWCHISIIFHDAMMMPHFLMMPRFFTIWYSLMLFDDYLLMPICDTCLIPLFFWLCYLIIIADDADYAWLRHLLMLMIIIWWCFRYYYSSLIRLFHAAAADEPLLITSLFLMIIFLAPYHWCAILSLLLLMMPDTPIILFMLRYASHTPMPAFFTLLMLIFDATYWYFSLIDALRYFVFIASLFRCLFFDAFDDDAVIIDLRDIILYYSMTTRWWCRAMMLCWCWFIWRYFAADISLFRLMLDYVCLCADYCRIVALISLFDALRCWYVIRFAADARVFDWCAPLMFIIIFRFDDAFTARWCRLSFCFILFDYISSFWLLMILFRIFDDYFSIYDASMLLFRAIIDVCCH